MDKLDQEPIKLPRNIRSQQVKERIFNAAIDIIKEYGYDYVTVSNVCKKAEVSVGSFYHHFGSKDELLSYYLIVCFESYRERFELIETDDVVLIIQENFRLYLEFCLEQGIAFLRNFYTPSNKSLDTRKHFTSERAMHLPVGHQTILAIEKAQSRGFIYEDIDPVELGDDICIIGKGCVFEYCINEGEGDLTGMCLRLIERYLRFSLTPEYFQKFSRQG